MDRKMQIEKRNQNFKIKISNQKCKRFPFLFQVCSNIFRSVTYNTRIPYRERTICLFRHHFQVIEKSFSSQNAPISQEKVPYKQLALYLKKSINQDNLYQVKQLSNRTNAKLNCTDDNNSHLDKVRLNCKIIFFKCSVFWPLFALFQS